MNEPPRPGFWLIANSVVVIGLCALGVYACLRAMNPPIVALVLLPLTVFLMLLAHRQYRGTFRGDYRSAGWAAHLLIVTAVVPGTMASASLFGGLFAGGKLDPVSLEWVILGAGSAAYLVFVGYLSQRWSLRIHSADRPPNPRQFSIADLIAITLGIAIVAGITRWILLAGR